MIYPRLKVARDLLTDDRVIFISIDDNEVRNLRIVCDEVFGESNFVTSIIVRSNSRGQTYNDIAKTHEYLLVYAKHSFLSFLKELEKDFDKSALNLADNIGSFNIRELRNRNPKFGKHNRPALLYPFYVNPNVIDKDGLNPVSLVKNDNYSIEVLPYNSEGKESCWRWVKPKSQVNITDNTLCSNLVAKQKREGGYNIYEKYRKSTFKVKSIWDENCMLTETGTTILKSLNFNGEFDFPKPTELIKRCLALSTDEGDYCLDFFSGSATTAHAVMQLNAENGGKRKFILVQLPELTDEKSEAYKASYINICEIGKERIRRAGMRIENELCKKKELLEGHASMKYAIGDDCDKDSSLWTNVLSNEEIDSAISKSEQLNQILVSLDTGFRVLKLDSTATNFEQIFKTYSPNTTIKIL